MRKVKFHLLLIACIISCTTNNKERNISDRNDFMDIHEFRVYQYYNDSLSSLEKLSNKEIFLNIRFGESKEKVTDKLFAAVEKRILEYDTKKLVYKEDI